MLTVDLLMSTNPCPDWPRARVARLLATRTVDTSSWVAFAQSCAVRKWRAPSFADLCLTACRYAARHYCTDVLIPWVQELTRCRVVAQRTHYGLSASAKTLAIWAALESWDGTLAQARMLRDSASAEARMLQGRVITEWQWTWRAAARTAAAAVAAADAADVATRITAAADVDDVAITAANAADIAVAIARIAACTADDVLFSLCARLDAVMTVQEPSP